MSAATVRVRRAVPLIRMLVPRELRIRYRQSALDILWAFINPVLILIVYGLVLTRSFDVGATCAPYLTSAWTGLVIWTFFSTAVGESVGSLLHASQLVTKLSFPREVLPLAMTGASLPDLIIGLSTLLVLMAVQGVPLRWAAIGALLPIAVIVVWSAAIGVFVAALAPFIRDLVHAVALILRVGFFASPVMYEASILPEPLRWTARVSPVAASIEGLRSTLLCGATPATALLTVHLVVATLALVASVAYLASVESRIVDLL